MIQNHAKRLIYFGDDENSTKYLQNMSYNS